MSNKFKKAIASLMAFATFSTCAVGINVSAINISGSIMRDAGSPGSTGDVAIVSETAENLNWLPTTMNDYEAFIAEYGVVSVHDKYIVYCDAVNYSTGDDVIMEQTGTAEIKKIKEYSITTDEPLPTGSTSHVVYVYEAVSAGTIEVTISQGRTWDPNSPKNVKSSEKYNVDEDLTITPIKKSNVVKGDVNDDGSFNVSDVVLFQKWLLAVPDVKLSNWKAADLCEDGTLNVFDLCMMKRELINKVEEKYPVENPEVIDEFTPCTATLEDDFTNWKIRIIIKCQYSVPDRIWTADDFRGIENIKKVKQYYDVDPYRQVLEITFNTYSKEDVLNTIHDIEALGLKEIKEIATVDTATGDV